MKILVDVQALQGHARHRGLGRYSLALAHAMSQIPEVTSLDVLLNAGTDPETIMEARKVVAARMPSARIHVFDAPWPWKSGLSLDVSAHARAERVRELAIRELDPDVLLISSLFELPFTSVLSVPEQRRPFTVVVAYDLLPFTDPLCAFPDEWSPFFSRRFEALKAADLLLAISDYTASELRRCLGPQCPPVRTIWGAPGELGELATVARPGFGDRRWHCLCWRRWGKEERGVILGGLRTTAPRGAGEAPAHHPGLPAARGVGGAGRRGAAVGPHAPGSSNCWMRASLSRSWRTSSPTLAWLPCRVSLKVWGSRSWRRGQWEPPPWPRARRVWERSSPTRGGRTTPSIPLIRPRRSCPCLPMSRPGPRQPNMVFGRSTEFTWPRTATLAVSAISDALDAGVPPPSDAASANPVHPRSQWRAGGDRYG